MLKAISWRAVVMEDEGRNQRESVRRFLQQPPQMDSKQISSFNGCVKVLAAWEETSRAV